VKLAFALFHYFPYGGLERDMLAVARVCQSRSHEVTIYCGGWQGEKSADMRIVELPVRAVSNHGRAQEFAARLQETLLNVSIDAVVGFNKMPGLDVYYAADVCFAQKAFEERNFFYRLTPRCRQYLALEKAVFGAHSHTEVLMISKSQIDIYQRYYHTPSERLHLLPPGIRRDCVLPVDYDARRENSRSRLKISADTIQILFVGSDYHRKGLDRVLRGIAAIEAPFKQRVHLLVAGQDKTTQFVNLARTLGIENQVRFLGPRDDIPDLMWASDLLLHPAYSEAAGLVLLEAMVAGLPVIASSACGHAHYIREFNMGVVLNDPITPGDMADSIVSIATQSRVQWCDLARHIAVTADIFSMPTRAAELIEHTAEAKRRRST